jgi:hypothetical protein
LTSSSSTAAAAAVAAVVVDVTGWMPAVAVAVAGEGEGVAVVVKESREVQNRAEMALQCSKQAVSGEEEAEGRWSRTRRRRRMF